MFTLYRLRSSRVRITASLILGTLAIGPLYLFLFPHVLAQVTPSTIDSTPCLFSRDVAPILVGNCIGCHSGDGAGLRRGKLDLSTYEAMMKGTPNHEVIVPGKPEESHLSLRIHGEETPRMPQGGDRVLADAAIAKIDAWIREGAKLDPGIDKRAQISIYAATLEELRRLNLSRMSALEKDKKAEEIGRVRFAQANPTINPNINSSEHFIIFSIYGIERAQRMIRTQEASHEYLARIAGKKATDWPEKLSIYVFNQRNDFIEFVRSVEERNVDIDVETTAQVTIPQPYVALIDPNGRDNMPQERSNDRSERTRRHRDSSSLSSAERSFNAAVAEAWVTGAVKSAGKPPGWLSAGLGAFLAQQIDPNGPRMRGLRAKVVEISAIGWKHKVNEILSDHADIDPEEMTAIGYVLVDWLLSSELRRGFPAFLEGMLRNPAELPKLLSKVYDSSRETFVTGSGVWAARHFLSAK